MGFGPPKNFGVAPPMPPSETDGVQVVSLAHVTASSSVVSAAVTSHSHHHYTAAAAVIALTVARRQPSTVIKK